MSTTPRYYRYYPQEEIDLGTMPFEGDWTQSDSIYQTQDWSGVGCTWYYNQNNQEFGRTVATKDARGRIRNVWTPGVTIGPRTITNPEDPTDVRVCPVWFGYCGDGVCTVKLPNGEQPEPYDPTTDGE